MTRTHVVAICGSRRDESYTRAALEVALEAAEDRGATTELLDLRSLDLPPLDADVDAERQGDGARLLEAVDAADSVLLGTPVYHGSYSGVLKNALDYCGFDEFEQKTVGLLAVSGGSFPVTALDHLRSVCRALNCWVLPHQAAIPKAYEHVSYEDGQGTVTNEEFEKRIRVLGRRAVEYAGIEPDPESFEAGENVGAGD